MNGISKMKDCKADEKKQIIAKKMGGVVSDDSFSKSDKKKITKANKNDHGKEPKHSWEI